MRHRPACFRFRSAAGAFAAAGSMALGACSGAEPEAASQSFAVRPAEGSTCETRPNNSPDKLRECVTLSGVRAHLAALQAIADANADTRAIGTAGYAASVAYVADAMTAAGYAVTLHPFVHVPPSRLSQLTPFAVTYDTERFTGSGAGIVTALVTAVGVNFVPPRANTSGCEASDFAGFPAGTIALLQRGTCTSEIKALNARSAGAAAVILFNQGDTPEREGLFVESVGADVHIPVVGASFAAALALSQPGSTALVRVLPAVTDHSVIAESGAGDPSNVVMVGAHLDSAAEGPGIQDNGSGAAAILETALQMARVIPRNKLRFAWWGGHEAGRVGSKAYIASLSAAERGRVGVYLDVEAIAAPNYGLFVYDGDDSDAVGSPAGPPGSAAIERVLLDFYAARGLTVKGVDLGVTADLATFVDAGIAVGGITTNPGGTKSAAEQALWGGTAGVEFDPCAQRACDGIENVNDTALEVGADAVADATVRFATSGELSKGRRVKRR